MSADQSESLLTENNKEGAESPRASAEEPKGQDDKQEPIQSENQEEKEQWLEENPNHSPMSPEWPSSPPPSNATPMEPPPQSPPTPPPPPPSPTGERRSSQNTRRRSVPRKQSASMMMCCVCCVLLLLLIGSVVCVYYLTAGKDQRINALVLSYTELDDGDHSLPVPLSTPTPSTTPRCPYSDAEDRRLAFVPKNASETLIPTCRKCVKDADFAETEPLCRLLCVAPEKTDADGDVWIVLSRRNFMRGSSSSSSALSFASVSSSLVSRPSTSSSMTECIFANATREDFDEGFGCDEELFLGLNHLAAMTDPNGSNRDMFEMRVVISDGSGGGGGSVLGSGSGRKIIRRSEFFIDSIAKGIFFEADPNAGKKMSTPFLAASSSGAGFCVNPMHASNGGSGGAACDAAVKGAYWRDATEGDMTLCAACCSEKDFGEKALKGGRKVVEVMIRKKRCLHGDAEIRKASFQMKIPPTLECFVEGAKREADLDTPMGKTTVKGGNDKHEFWCSPTNGMKILERNPPLDSTSKCLFDATEEPDWQTSKYQHGFGCGHQFFIGTKNAEALTKPEAPMARARVSSGRMNRGKLKFRATYDEKQIFEQQADITFWREDNGRPQLRLDTSTVTSRSDPNSIFKGYYEGIDPRFCIDDDVKNCANAESRWYMVRKEDGDSKISYVDDLVLTSCDPKKLIRNIGDWEKRNITTVQMFIDNS